MVLYLRVVRLRLALITIGMGALLAGIAVQAIPDEWLYRHVPTVGWAVAVNALTGVIAAAWIAVPRVEAAEAIASRRLVALRAATVVVPYAGCALVGLVAAIGAGSAWYLWPITGAGCLMAAVTFLLAVHLPAIYVVPCASAYVAACALSSRGTQRWDLLLAHPSVALTAGSIAAMLSALALFGWRGGRAAASAED